MLKRTGVDLRKYIARKGLFGQIPIPLGLKPLEPEITLGRAILDRLLLDCLEDEETIEWWDIQNEHFHTICYIAYLEPQLVIQRFNTTLERLQEGQMIIDILDELINPKETL